MSAWAEQAWRVTGRTAELWFATFTPGFHAQWGALNDEVGLWMVDPPQPPETAEPDLSAHLRLTGDLLDRKHRALRAHASQTRALEELVGSETYRAWWSTESFVAVPDTEAEAEADAAADADEQQEQVA